MASPSTTAIIIGVLSWYASNVAILITNKVLLSPNGFRLPITLTLGHAFSCSLMGGLGAFFKILPWQPLQSWRQAANVVFLSLVFCATIVAANASLKDIPVSFNQAIGSSTPVFTACFAFLFQGKRETFMTYSTLVPIVLGVIIASRSEPLFHLVGFCLCLSAAAGRAFKTVLQSMLMTNPAEQLNPHSLLFYMSTVCTLVLLPAALIMEPGSFARGQFLVTTRLHFGWWMMSNLMLSYAVNYTNFLVTKLTSALTLQVLGNMKGVVATIVSLMFFQNPVTWRFVVGYSIVTLGVYLYSDSKRRAPSVPAALAAATQEAIDSARSTPAGVHGSSGGGGGVLGDKAAGVSSASAWSSETMALKHSKGDAGGAKALSGNMV